MNGNEHVGLSDSRAPDPLAQLEELITITRQHSPHARLTADPLCHCTRNGKRDVLFSGAVVTDGSGVLPSVARIDCNDHVTIGLARLMRSAYDSQGARARIRRRDRELSERDDEPRSARCFRLHPLCAGSRRRFQSDDQSQRATWLNAGMDIGNQPVHRWHACAARDACVPEINDRAVRSLEAEALLHSRGTQDQRDAGPLRSGGQLHSAQFRRRSGAEL